MSTQTQDRIEREISIGAPVERVWEVLTRPEHIGRWFGQDAGGSGEPRSMDLRPGGIMRLDHGGDIYPTRIVSVEPPRYFAYRWASAFPGVEAAEDNSTLVEFTLTPESEGTLLRVVESGFATLDIPEDRVAQAGYESHSEGWTQVLAGFAAYTEKLPV
ncbi:MULTISPECIES: SRPBCC family protein [unclassified Streptomyces]|uniref:SRPBCC family protein n=1 Tax=unclassified Streptomyces TaxID=2593676 RepID=UPI00380E2234